MSSLQQGLSSRVIVLYALTQLLLRPSFAVAEAAPVEALTAAVLDGSEGSRVSAATRLYHVGVVDEAVRRLLPRLEDEDPGERCLAARLLGLLRSARAVPALVERLEDEDWAVRRDVAEALGQIGATAAAPALERRLEDPVARVRIAAARSLGELSRTGRIPDRLAAEPDPEVRLHLVEVLGEHPSPSSTRALEAALRDPVESVRLLAAGFAVERGSVAAAALLARRAATAPGVTARVEAATALGRAHGRASALARERLAPLLEEAPVEVGLAAAAALAGLDDPRGVAHLSRVARESRDPEHRARAIALLDGLSARP